MGRGAERKSGNVEALSVAEQCSIMVGYIVRDRITVLCHAPIKRNKEAAGLGKIHFVCLAARDHGF